MGPKLPWTKWFFSDWLADQGVREVSYAARGLWIDMLALMDLSPRRGFLQTASGHPMTAAMLALRTGGAADEVAMLLEELKTARVFSVTRDGHVYSRRMIRDENRRKINTENGKRNSLYRNAKRTPKRKSSEHASDPPSEASGIWISKDLDLTSKKEREDPAIVLRIYGLYPKKVGKADALKSIEKALRIVSSDVLIEAVSEFSVSPVGQDPQFCPHPATWFNAHRWDDDREAWKYVGNGGNGHAKKHEPVTEERKARNAERMSQERILRGLDQ